MQRRPHTVGVVPWRRHGADVELGVVPSAKGERGFPASGVAGDHPLAAALATAKAAGLESGPPGPHVQIDNVWVWPVEVTAPADVVWLPLDKAAADCADGWQRDAVELLRSDPPGRRRQVVLVRHAKAGKRSEFAGPDDQRPLDPRGQAQAGALAGLLAAYRPSRIVSSDARRCLQTIGPLARALALDVRQDHLLSEDGSAAEPAQAMAALRDVVHQSGRTIVSTQRKAIERLLPPVLEDLGHVGQPPETPRKAGLLVLHLALTAPSPVLVEELPPPDEGGTG